MTLLKQADSEKGPIPVKGRANGAGFQTTIVKLRGKWRLYLNGEMRRQAGIDTGDKASVELAYDPKPPAVDIALALDKNRKAKIAFAKLTPSRQKEIFRYLNWLKTEETLDRNIKKLIEEKLEY